MKGSEEMIFQWLLMFWFGLCLPLGVGLYMWRQRRLAGRRDAQRVKVEVLSTEEELVRARAAAREQRRR